MNRPGLLALVVGLFLTLPHSFTAHAADNSPTTPEAVLKVMLKGVEDSDIDRFTYKAEPELKARVTKEVMIRLGGTLGPKLKQGYSMTYMGQLKQQGLVTFLYKIEFKTAADDVLVRLAVRGDAVAGIFFE